jgi:hypothetical protein
MSVARPWGVDTASGSKSLPATPGHSGAKPTCGDLSGWRSPSVRVSDDPPGAGDARSVNRAFSDQLTQSCCNRDTGRPSAPGSAQEDSRHHATPKKEALN